MLSSSSQSNSNKGKLKQTSLTSFLKINNKRELEAEGEVSKSSPFNEDKLLDKFNTINTLSSEQNIPSPLKKFAPQSSFPSSQGPSSSSKYSIRTNSLLMYSW